jgi:rhomboid protease GluP
MGQIGANGPDVDPWILFALAACEPLRGRPGCFVSPEIPAKAIDGAVIRYLRFYPGELILAVIDRSVGSTPLNGCVLTTHRIQWSGRPTEVAHPPEPTTEGHPGAVLTREAESWGCSRSYRALPEVVEARGPLPYRLELGDRSELPLPGLDAPTIEALAEVLTMLRRGAVTGNLAGSIPPEMVERARAKLRDVAGLEQAVRRIASERVTFHMQAKAATPHVVVYRLIMAACILVFLAMIGKGLPLMGPNAFSLLPWGANSGFAVALGGERWRLFTSMFVHANLLHVAVNMLCLYQMGPLVERLFGNLGFALLYLAAGIGGSLASAWYHPLVVGVGASGAIFGLFGALGGFLLVHRARIPASVLRSMSSGVGTFVVFNTLFSLASPLIDNAAHLGGLATGFLAGLLLARPWPTPKPTSGLIRQLVLGAALLGGLWLATGLVATRIRANPEVAAMEARIKGPAEGYNALMQGLRPCLDRFDDLNSRLGAVLSEISKATPDDSRTKQVLDALIGDARNNQIDLAHTPAAGEELVAIRDRMAGAQAELLEALRALRRYFDHPEDASAIEGPEGFSTHLNRSQREAQQFQKLREAYLERHQLVPVDREPDA